MSRFHIVWGASLIALSIGLPTCAADSATESFLDDVQQRTFRFFWETTDGERGLVLDRYPSDSPCSIAAVGFGLTAYAVGVERGWVSRLDAAERVRRTLQFFADSKQSDEPLSTGHRGFYYHFLSVDEGLRWRKCELSSIDTCLLMGGVLFCREYFHRDNPLEAEIRTLADRLYRRVEWDWLQPRPPLIGMAWHPERGFGGADYKGYNEAMLLYLLAMGSPTHPVEPAAWEAFTRTYNWESYFDQTHVNFAPLFGHQYSHVWVDFRDIQDRFMQEKDFDYFQNSRRATLSQQAYGKANPLGWKGYGERIWGLTACDGPANAERPFSGETRRFHTYWARGTSAAYSNDDGTLAPTAAGGSIPFAPEITIPALMAMKEKYGDRLYTKYGFLDSFNPSFTYADVEVRHGSVDPDLGWVDGDYLGIDQGPILLMIENHRSELIWKTMRRSPYLRKGLERAGFQGGWLDASE